MALVDRRLLVVLGKGGVGKTTVTAALALASARSGRRTLAVEVASQQRLARLFDAGEPGFAETPLQPGLTGLSIDPQRALEEYLVLAVRVRAIAERLADSPALGYVAAAAPGLRELVTLGKIWHLSEQRLRGGGLRYDLIVVDAPATGHGIGLLKTPKQFVEIARLGRINAEAKAVGELIADRDRTGVVLVTLPEEMPVTETIESLALLRATGLEADRVVVNALYPELFDAGEVEQLGTVVPGGETGAAAVRAALSHAARRRRQAAEVARLADAVDLPRIELPFLFEPVVDVDAVGELADRLGPAIEAAP